MSFRMRGQLTGHARAAGATSTDREYRSDRSGAVLHGSQSQPSTSLVRDFRQTDSVVEDRQHGPAAARRQRHVDALWPPMTDRIVDGLLSNPVHVESNLRVLYRSIAVRLKPA